MRVLGHVAGQKFEGDEAAQRDVLGFIDHTHAASAQLLNYAVMGNDLAQHDYARWRASSYRYSTCERVAPSMPCTWGLLDSIT